MTVYVDDMYRHSIGHFGRMKMSHMVADTEAELMQMADRIRLPRKYAQRGHLILYFDVSMSKRKRAVELGAEEVTMREILICTKGKK